MLRLPLATLLFGGAFHYAYVAFIHPTFAYAAYDYSSPPFAAILGTYLLLLVPVIGHRPTFSPSSFGAALIFAVVYVPAQLSLVFSWQHGGMELAVLQGGLALSMTALLRVAALGPSRATRRRQRRASRFLAVAMAGLTVGALAALVISYGQSMRVVTFDEVYNLRLESAKIETGPWSNYLISWLLYCMMPYYLARGVARRKIGELGVGLSIGVLLYAAMAWKAAILMPVIMIALFFLIRSGERFFVRLLTFLAAVVALFTAVLPNQGAFYWPKSILLARILGNGGWTMAKYHDFFGENGFTYYTHIWPVRMVTGGYPYGELSLGQVIGLEYTGSTDANFNANFWASDGLAAMGIGGLVPVTVALCAVLWAINRAARGWSSGFVALWLSAFWLALTNLPLSTAVMSGGGLLTLLSLELSWQAATRLPVVPWPAWLPGLQSGPRQWRWQETGGSATRGAAATSWAADHPGGGEPAHRSMNIVHVEDFFHPDAGYQVNLLSRLQVAQGHRVTIVTAELDKIPDYITGFFGKHDIPAKDAAFEAETGVSIVRVPLLGWYSGRAILRPSVFKTVAALEPDVAFVHGEDTLTGMLFILRNRSLGYPLVLDCHMLEMASRHPLREAFRAFFRRFVTPIILRDRIPLIRVVDSDFVEKHLAIPLDYTDLLSFGTDTSHFRPDAANRRRVRAELGIGDDAFCVLYAGKLDDSKGGRFLADAVERRLTPPDGRAVELVIIGNTVGEYGEAVEEVFRRSQNKIVRLPTQRYFDLARYYQAADLLVFPRQCSMSFFEAQSCGLPVLFEDNEINTARAALGNARTFAAGDLADFRARLLELASLPPAQRRQMGNRAREFVLANYDYVPIARQFTAVLERAVTAWRARLAEANSRAAGPSL